MAQRALGQKVAGKKVKLTEALAMVTMGLSTLHTQGSSKGESFHK